MSIRVGVVSEYLLYRESLTRLISGDLGIHVLGATGPMGIPSLLAMGADVLLLDADHLRPASASDHFSRAAGMARIIVVGIEGGLEEILDWLEAGAHGFADRDTGRAGLLGIIHAAAAKSLQFPPLITEALIARLQSRGPRSGSGWEKLTPREKEIKSLKNQHLSNKDIAHRLHIEIATVKTHVHNIMEKSHFQVGEQVDFRASTSDTTRPSRLEDVDPLRSRM